MKQRYWILLIVGALPLLIYPFILLANVMSLAATKTSTPVRPLQNLTSTAFLWSSTAYPIVFVVCLLAAIASSRSAHGTAALMFAIVPLAYLALCVLLFIGWIVTSP